jgi:hypothetical protein
LRAKLQEALRKEYGPDAAAGQADEYLEFALNYLRRCHAPGSPWASVDEAGARLGDFSEETVTAILGTRKMHPDEFVHRLIEARDAIHDPLQLLGTSGVRDLWELDGIENALHGAVRRSGYEKGFVFELELATVLRDEEGELILQVMIDGKSGPDFVRLRRGKATIGQAKSFDSHEALVGYGGEFFRQFGSDLRRMWREHVGHPEELWALNGPPRLMVKPADPGRPVRAASEYEAVDEVYTFFVDEARLHSRIAASTGDEIAEALDTMRRSNAALQSWVEEVNAHLAGSVADTPAARRAILDRSGQRIGKSSRTIADALDAAVAAAGRPVDVRELFVMRLAIDPKTGRIDTDLVARILAMRPPFQLELRMYQPELTVT